MAASSLAKKLGSVDWNGPSSVFQRDTARLKRVYERLHRLAVWSKGFESAEKGNPALPFIRAMQMDAYDCTVLAALALYKPSAGSMRAMVDSALYYSFFRSHPAELSTLARDSKFYVGKSDVFAFHFAHTPDFKTTQSVLGLESRFNDWYKRVSAMIHGQLPGRWTLHSGLGEIKHATTILEQVISEFEASEDLVHRLFLCTAGRDSWSDFSADARKTLLKGLAPKEQSVLGLTIA